MTSISLELCKHVFVEDGYSKIYYVCHENKSPKEAANYLMTRRLKDEF